MKMHRVIVTAISLVLAVATASPAYAAPPPGTFFQGFEKNTNGWFSFAGSTVTRVPSGSPSSYASGIASAQGSFHARLGLDPSPDSCTFGGGVAPIFYGPFTRWGGFSSTFPTGGYKTSLDIYLDVSWAATHPGKRFDWSSAINDPSGNFRRDFVFNAGTEPALAPPGFFIAGGNNATRCGAFPEDPGHMPILMTKSGWYTFEHQSTGVAGGPLTVVRR